jgi:hypothetical protein
MRASSSMLHNAAELLVASLRETAPETVLEIGLHVMTLTERPGTSGPGLARVKPQLRGLGGPGPG